MGYMTQRVVIHLPVREDDAPLSDVEVVEQVRAVVEKAVNEWYDSSPEAQESLVYSPDYEGSVGRA